jgi:hypothetical protein
MEDRFHRVDERRAILRVKHLVQELATIDKLAELAVDLRVDHAGVGADLVALEIPVPERHPGRVRREAETVDHVEHLGVVRRTAGCSARRRPTSRQASERERPESCAAGSGKQMTQKRERRHDAAPGWLPEGRTGRHAVRCVPEHTMNCVRLPAEEWQCEL